MNINPLFGFQSRHSFLGPFYCHFLPCSYTSIGSVHDTVPNSLLCVDNLNGEEKFQPAYLLSDGRLERAGRLKKFSSQACVNSHAVSNGNSVTCAMNGSTLTASVIAVGDEILYVFHTNTFFLLLFLLVL